MYDYYTVIQRDKATFEIGLNIQNCYVTYKHSNAIE